MTPEERYKRRLRRVQITGHAASTVVECYVLLEILWHYRSGGTETFREAVVEWWEGLVERARERSRIRESMDMIRDLPETD